MAAGTKKKRNTQRIIGTAVTVALGLAAGVLGGIAIVFRGIEPYETPESGFGTFLLRYCGYLLLFGAAWLLGVIIHEGGHLVFGLLTGYRFRSFRVFSLMLVKTEEGLAFKRFSLAGTGGQCLMAPPDYDGGNFPYMLYNFGGALLNLAAACVFGGLYLVSSGIGVWAVFCILTVVMNIYFALANGIPLMTKMIPNDGYNATHLGKDPSAKFAFWSQLRINELLQAEGKRLRELDPALFAIADDADLSNPLTATQLINRENRAMDAHKFEEAKQLIGTLTRPETELMGLYRSLLEMDRMFIDILDRGGEADVSPMETKEMQSFCRSMRNFPSVIRTEYAAAKAVKHDEKKAAECLARFRALEKTYPTKADLDAERELMELVR